MDGWETLQIRAQGMLQGTQRILEEGGDPCAVDGVRDAIHAILDVCRAQRKGSVKPDERYSPLFPTNGHGGDQPIAAQIDPILARLNESGRLDAPLPPQDTLPVMPSLPPHLIEAYFSNQPTPPGESE